MTGDPTVDPVFQATILDEPDFEKQKWYFWTESWADTCGPYNTEEEARAAIRQYAAQL